MPALSHLIIVSTRAPSMFSQNKALKTIEEVALQILLLCQVGIQTVVNILLFVHIFSLMLTGSQQRSTQVVLIHMAVANALNLLITAFPNKMTIFVSRQSPTDLKCKSEYYIHLVARSTKLCSTCFLSTYQFVSLVPGNWSRLMLKGKAPKIVNYSWYSWWLFSVLNNVYILMKVIGPQSTSKTRTTTTGGSAPRLVSV